MERDALANWVNDDQVSIIKERFILNKKMMNDPDMFGLVERGSVGKQPKGGCWKYPARVLA